MLVVGGSQGMSGAAALASRAAFRADAGYVAVAAPKESLPVLETLVVEAVEAPLEDVFDAAGRAGALALGPGLGRSPEKKALVRRLLEETDVPAVVDADALYELEPFTREAATVLTPHSGELGRLIGEESSWVDAHRLEALGRAVERVRLRRPAQGRRHADRRAGAGVLVHGTHTTPALATAGTGDVLTGIAAAFLAKHGGRPDGRGRGERCAHGIAAIRLGQVARAGRRQT